MDRDGNLYLSGETASADFPVANPIQPVLAGSTDAFLSKVNSAGDALLYSTYIGGTGMDIAYAMKVDQAGNAYLAE